MEILFYQNGNFRDGQGELIPYYYEDMMDSTIYNYPKNLFVNNIKIFFGYELDKYAGETLELYSNSPESFTAKAPNETKEIIFRWIHQNPDQTFVILKEEDLKEEYIIKWYRYSYGYKNFDQYGGPHWEPLEEFENHFIVNNFLPRLEKTTEEIKVVGLIKQVIQNENGDTDEVITPYYSNILTFKNVIQTVDDVTYNAVSALTIKCLDNSEGNYFIYDQNGKIINAAQGSGTEKQFKVLFNGAELTSTIGTLGYIKWFLPFDNDGTTNSDNDFEKDENGQIIPLNSNTMILKNESLWGKDDGYYRHPLNKAWYDRIIKDGVDYIGIKREPDEEGNLITTQSYMIKNYWSQQDSNNTIQCEVEIDGILYKASEELRFGKAGTSGTNTTFVLDMVGGQNALSIEGDNNTLIIRALLYDSEGKIISISDPENIKWSWYKNTLDGNGKDKEYMKLPSDNPTGQNIIITRGSGLDKIPNDNYYILQAEYGTNPTLYSYLPIPLKTKDVINIEGAREIIYNHQGQPSYYSGPYVLWKKDANGSMVEQKAEWELTYPPLFKDENEEASLKEQDKKLFNSYLPSLRSFKRGTDYNYKALSASTFYASGFNDKVCVSTSSGWSQPILILQSQYDFSMLNNWDGKLNIDEENGTVLATMLGAGRKNENNTFSGVFIGDIYSGTDNMMANKETGVYGLHEGVLSYGLKDDGTAFFGKKDRGQILIDGNSSIICNASYRDKENSYGMGIDLDDGFIHIKGKESSQIKFQSKDPYFIIDSLKNNRLVHIGTDGYYLQSDNYEEEQKGTKLNLQNSELSIFTEHGKIFMSGEDLEDNKPYFQIALNRNSNNAGINDYSNNLFYIDKNEYYLQSQDYDGIIPNTLDNGKYYLYLDPEDNSIIAIDTETNKVYTTINGGTAIGEEKIFEKREEIQIPVEGSIPITTIISAEQVKQEYLSSLKPSYKNTLGKGIFLDLKNGILNGYDLYLKGTNRADTSKTFILDSSSPSTPFTIGDNFKINWDGTLTCHRLNELTNTGNSQGYAINISDNFYVTKGGAAGGGSANFGSGFFGGLSVGSHNINTGTNIYIPSGISVAESGYGGNLTTAILGEGTVFLTLPDGWLKGETESGESVTISGHIPSLNVYNITYSVSTNGSYQNLVTWS